MGIEKDQITAIARFFDDDTGFVPAPALYDPAGKTPNQHALACAVGLAWSRLGPPRGASSFAKPAAQAQTLALFQTMRDVGHEATGPDFGDEQGCPDPHSGLWMGAMTTILREARLQNLPEILADSIGYFADHLALCGAFWTPAGVRVPCARARPVAGKPLKPNWSVDSMAYAVVRKLPTRGLAKPDALTLDILRDSESLFPEILARQPELKLFVPVRRWSRPRGGFVAALDHDVPMNDRLSWLEVDAAGGVVAASPTLGDFTAPAGDPVLVGASGVGAPRGGPADVSPPPPPFGPPAGARDARQALLALTLSHRSKDARRAALAALDAGDDAGALAAARQITVNPGQQAALDAALRLLGA